MHAAARSHRPAPVALPTPDALQTLQDSERALTRCARDERDVAVLFRLRALIGALQARTEAGQ